MATTTPSPVTTAAPSTASSLSLPVAAIICIAISAYVVVIIIFLVVRQALVNKGMCQCKRVEEGEAGEDNKCGRCCASMGEACACCKTPHMNACLQRCCPNKKNFTCADFLLCQCCVDCQCCGDKPLCNCGSCDCACGCQPGECEVINCLCCEIRVKEPVEPDDDQDLGAGAK